MIKLKKIKKDKIKNPGFTIMIALLCVMLAAGNMGDEAPITRLFGLLEFIAAIILIAGYLLHLCLRIMPAEKRKKKRL
ncbi:MAG TPA: hypothetical protein VIF12_03620, partial [Micavibrio sp.]